MSAHIRNISIKTKSGSLKKENITCVHCWEEPSESINVNISDSHSNPKIEEVLGLTIDKKQPEMVAGEFLGHYETRIYQCKVCHSLILDFLGNKYMLLSMLRGE